jgi:hypothetical protein
MKWKYFWTWLPGVPIAITNGSIRQFIFQIYLNDLHAHQLSVLTFILLFGLYVWLILPVLKLNSTSEAFRVGLFWLVATVIFEFIFGHFVMGHPWSKLFHDYNFLEGRLWIVVLIWITLSPFVCYRLRYRIE